MGRMEAVGRAVGRGLRGKVWGSALLNSLLGSIWLLGSLAALGEQSASCVFQGGVCAPVCVCLHACVCMSVLSDLAVSGSG